MHCRRKKYLCEVNGRMRRPLPMRNGHTAVRHYPLTIIDTLASGLTVIKPVFVTFRVRTLRGDEINVVQGLTFYDDVVIVDCVGI
eukprot:6180493-Pleurochrysis_carterae.AAC.1